jgi:hypothetical protein
MALRPPEQKLKNYKVPVSRILTHPLSTTIKKKKTAKQKALNQLDIAFNFWW